MNAIYTTYTLFYVLYRWPADGQLAKMKTHVVVFAWNLKLFFFRLMAVVYPYS